MVLAQLEALNVAGAGSKPAEHSRSSVAAAPMGPRYRKISLHTGFACKGPLWGLSIKAQPKEIWGAGADLSSFVSELAMQDPC